MTYHLHNLPSEERPRERLLRHGPESMSTIELIAIVLGSGTKSNPVLQLSQQLVSEFGSLQALSDATIAELQQIDGIGLTKAIQLKAIFSLAARLSRQNIYPKSRIESSLHVYHLLKEDMEKEKRELFVALFLDTKGCVICQETIAIGTLSNILVHPREVFYPAIRHKAASMIIAHNHPSGDPSPSKEDLVMTRNLIEAGKLIGIHLDDHVIIGENRFVSLRESFITLFC